MAKEDSLEDLAKRICVDFNLHIMMEERPTSSQILLKAAHKETGTSLVFNSVLEEKTQDTLFTNLMIQRNGALGTHQSEIFSYLQDALGIHVIYAVSTPYLAYQTFTTLDSLQQAYAKVSPFLLSVIGTFEHYRNEADLNHHSPKFFKVALPLTERIEPLAQFFCKQFIKGQSLAYERSLHQSKVLIPEQVVYPRGINPS